MYIGELSDHEDSPSHESSSSNLQRGHIREMGSVVASVTGYVGDERSDLIKLINSSGAYYVGKLLKGSVTHLVCWTFEGPKYEMAKRFGIRIINHQWFEDCFKAGKYLDESPYTIRSGKDVGALLWKEHKHKSCSSQSKNSKLGSSPKKAYKKDHQPKYIAGKTCCEALSNNAADFLLPPKRPMSDEILDISDDDHDLQVLLQNKRPKRNRQQRKAPLGVKKWNAFRFRDDSIQDGPVYSSSMNSFEASSFFKNSKNQSENYAACSGLAPVGDKTKDSSLSLRRLSPSASMEEALRDDRASCSLGCAEEAFVEKSIEMPAACTLVPADIECAICHTEHIASAEGVLACGHCFCYQCIMQWAIEAVSKIPTCPLCKASFDMITKREQKPPSSDGEVAYEESVVVLRGLDTFASEQFEEGTPTQSCILCGIGDMEEYLLTCSGCRARSAHRFCLDPPWPLSSANHWYCGRCSQRRRADTGWWHQLHFFEG